MKTFRMATESDAFRLPALGPLAIARKVVAANLYEHLQPRACRLSQRLVTPAADRGAADVSGGVAVSVDKAWIVADDSATLLSLLDQFVIDQLMEAKPAGRC